MNTDPCTFSTLPDSTPLTSLTIPGTHDTMTSACTHPYYRTQALSLTEQLDAGVRFLDIRLRRTMVAAHREWVSDITGQEILDTLRAHLSTHPRDTLFVRFQNANELKDDFEAYGLALHELIRAHRDLFWVPPAGASQWPTLGEVRGKIIAFECAPAAFQLTVLDEQPWAVPWHNNPTVIIQDDWDGPDPADKLTHIRELYRHSQNPHALLLNHVSATNGELKVPAAWAAAMNPEASTMLHEGGGRGILIFDFITPELINTTWES